MILRVAKTKIKGIYPLKVNVDLYCDNYNIKEFILHFKTPVKKLTASPKIALSIALLIPAPSYSFPYKEIVDKYSLEYQVDPLLVKSMMRQESAFNVKAVSNKDAHGLMQLIPATAKRFGVTDIYNPDQNIKGGIKYISWLQKRFGGNLNKVLAGYNAGEGAVDKYNGIPPYKETINYIKKVRAYYDEYRNITSNHQLNTSSHNKTVHQDKRVSVDQNNITQVQTKKETEIINRSIALAKRQHEIKLAEAKLQANKSPLLTIQQFNF